MKSNVLTNNLNFFFVKSIILSTSSIKLFTLNQGIGLFVHIFDPILMRQNVSFNKLVFFHQIEDRCKIFTNVFSIQQGLDFSKPKIQILNWQYKKFVKFLAFHDNLTPLTSSALLCFSKSMAVSNVTAKNDAEIEFN